jgi:hypothetical protein
VTGKTAKDMAEAASDDAVVARLAPMCVAKAMQDPEWGEAQDPGRDQVVGPQRLRVAAGLGHDVRREAGGC